MKHKQTGLVLAFIFSSLISFGQYDVTDSLQARFKTRGGFIGYGKAINKETHYRVFYLAGDFSWSFTRKPKKKFFVGWYLEPQINPVRTKRPWDIEVGTNAGLRSYIKVNSNLYFYQMLGSGPHFITADVKRQANGFIFSDNFAVGAFKRLSDNGKFLNIQFRWRHLSNAGLEKPNSGIDTWNIMIGLSNIQGR